MTRKGALNDTIEVWHLDLPYFIDLRKKEGDDRGRAQNLFLTISYPDEFMSRLDNYFTQLKNGNKDPEVYWTLFDPYDTPELCDLYGEEFTKKYREYEELFHNTPELFNPNTSTVKISSIAKKIAKSCLEEGMPFSYFKCTTNKAHKHPNLGTIYSANLCVTGDTKILTQEYGDIEIATLVGKVGANNVTLWNGEEWSKSNVFKTSDSENIWKIVVDKDGKLIELNTTAYHKFYKYNAYGAIEEVRAYGLIAGDILELPNIPGEECHNITVVSVEKTDREEPVYCAYEPIRHKVVFNGVLTGNCMEMVQPVTPNEMAVCNLGSINLARLTDDDRLRRVTKLSMRFLDNVVDASGYVNGKAAGTQIPRRSTGLNY